jgi:hypothetical protein
VRVPQELGKIVATAPFKIEKWSKAALVKWRAQKEQGILKHNDAVKSLASYHVRGASFNPTELKLASGMPEADWMEILRAVSHVYESAHFWLGDAMVYGTALYGVQTAYDLARQATGLSHSTLQASYRCAKRYAPEQRKPQLSFHHHNLLAYYKPELREKILNEAIEIGLTTRQCKEIAEKECGKREKPKTGRVNVMVHLWPETVERLKAMADGKQLTWFVSRIIESWLREHGEEACLRTEMTTQERREAWRKAGICYICGTNPPTEGRYTCERCRETQRLIERITYRRPGSARYHRGRSNHAATVATIEA